MLKSLSLGLGLFLSLGTASVSLAGGHHEAPCTTCGIASPQGTIVSPQSVIASPQSCDTCAAPKKCGFKLPKMHMPKISFPKCTYTYEWVLKKKKVWNKGCGGCGSSACDSCGGEAVAYPSSQVAPSGQATYAAPQYAAPQYAAPQAAGQTSMISAPGEMRPAMAADNVPPAPTVAAGSYLQLTPANN